MKRIFSIIGCAVLLVFIPLSSVWAVWEGNAGIASATEFPGAGLFAKSDMFPKNTVVEIENLETEITIRAIITGTSGIPGLVAVLSPETASALNIRSGSVSRVRISVPSVIEKPARGTAAESSRTTAADPDINPAEATSSAAPVATSAAPAVTEPALASTVSAPIATVPTSATPESSPAQTPEIPLETIAASPENPLVSLDEVPPISTSEKEAEPVTQPEMIQEPQTLVADQPEAFENEPEISSAPVIDSEELPADIGNSEVTLVPADPRPPEVPSTVEDVPIAETMAVAPLANASVATAQIDAPVPTPQPAVVPAIAPEPVGSRDPVSISDLPVIKSLVKGSYYIQIATMSDASNVRSIFNTYSKKYPIAIEKQSDKNGDIMKVYIGPIQKDEYGAVLDRFQKLGFKDAFVKKGQ